MFFLLGSIASENINAQGFVVEHDTVYINYSGVSDSLNQIIPDSTDIKLQWKVMACDFPGDWQNNQTIFCDNGSCWPLRDLWPSSLALTSLSYTALVYGPFRYHIDLTGATTYGTHYITLMFFNIASPTYTAYQTYIVTLPE